MGYYSDRDQLISSLYLSEYKRLYRVAFHEVGDHETAEELVHETFALALSRWEKLKDHPKPAGWLMETLVNLSRNEKRLQHYREVSLEELFAAPATEDRRGIEELLPKQLAQQDKEVLIWRYELELDYREIANRLGVSETGSRSRVHRAIERCRKLLENKK